MMMLLWQLQLNSERRYLEEREKFRIYFIISDDLGGAS
jgi:hypothetical protein